jgi:hypothetical protein
MADLSVPGLLERLQSASAAIREVSLGAGSHMMLVHLQALIARGIRCCMAGVDSQR